MAANDVSCGWLFGSADRVTLESNGAIPMTFAVNGGTRLTIDTSGNVIPVLQTSAPALATNGQMVFALTSNTNLRISVRGTDGTTRVANVTLA
jgi:hypothetical protein